jgi:predicted dehydrogenase
VGTGALGRHHVRILSGLPGAELVGVYDASTEAAEAVVREQAPGTRVFTGLDALAAEVEAMVVAVPTTAHGAVGGALLSRGIHVLIEKPMASSLAEADRLLELADRAGRTLAVGHVEFYNPAVQALVGLGIPPRFVEVQRLGIFSPRSLDVDVILDLMIHDLQILHALDPSPVAEVRATGIPVLSPRIDIANARVALESGCVANLTASRVSAERVRKLRAFLPSRYYSLDYQAQEIRGYRLEAPAAGEERPRIVPDDLPTERAEPLAQELAAFFAACRGEAVPWVDGRQGRQALATALSVVAAVTL